MNFGTCLHEDVVAAGGKEVCSGMAGLGAHFPSPAARQLALGTGRELAEGTLPREPHIEHPCGYTWGWGRCCID